MLQYMPGDDLLHKMHLRKHAQDVHLILVFLLRRILFLFFRISMDRFVAFRGFGVS